LPAAAFDIRLARTRSSGCAARSHLHAADRAVVGTSAGTCFARHTSFVVAATRRGVAAADGRHRIHVVEVSVGEQDGRWTEPVLAAYLGQAVLDPDTRVDDEALLPRAGSQDVAVGAEGGGGEGDGEHGWSVASGRLPRLGRRCRDDTRSQQ
jgi:hypothetical protein